MRLLHPAIFSFCFIVGFMAYTPAPVAKYIDMSGMSDREIFQMVMRQM